MPFRQGYEGVYDQATLARLQDVFEYIWLAITDTLAPLVSREDIARQVLAAHESGMPPDRIKEQVLAGLLRSGVPSSSQSVRRVESPDAQK
jgi:hypothetical protein